MHLLANENQLYLYIVFCVKLLDRVTKHPVQLLNIDLQWEQFPFVILQIKFEHAA